MGRTRVDGDLQARGIWLTAKDGEIENYDGTRGINLLLFGCFC